MRKTILLSVLILLASIFSTTSCSVYMASKKEGTTVDEVIGCRTKGCLLAKGAELIDSKTTPAGKLAETYKVPKATGSAGRAAMHGILDVLTLGLWEVAGTPIEGSKKKKSFFAIKVTYKSDNETIDKVELLQ